jgi:hypothetical protein
MKRIIFTLCVFIAFLTSVHAGELYHCIDRDGNAIVTDNPQDGMKNCVLKESFKGLTPEELAEKEKTEKEKMENQKEVAKEAKRKYVLCVESASKHKDEGWNTDCKSLNQNPFCSLPSQIALRWDKNYNEETEQCLQLYPQNTNP